MFGTSGNAAGTCMNNVFASIPTANYRSRGVTAVVVMSRGPNRIGFGGGYARRNFIAPNVPGSTGIQVDGTSDETFYGQIFASRELGRNTSIGANGFASYSNSDLPGAKGVFAWGANTIFNQRFGHLSATAAAGIYGFDGQGNTKDTQVQAVLGLRYGF